MSTVAAHSSTAISDTADRDARPAANSTIGWSALLFSLVPLPVLFVPHESLGGGETGGQVISFFREHFAMQQWQTMMHLFSALALVVFVVSLSSALRRAEGGSRVLSHIAQASGLLAAAVIIASMGLVSSAVALVHSPDAKVPGEMVAALYYTGWDLHFKTNYLVPLFTGAVALVAFGSNAFPRTWAWLTAGLAVASLVTVFGNLSPTAYFAQFPAFMLLLLWALVTGVTFLRRPSDA